MISDYSLRFKASNTNPESEGSSAVETGHSQRRFYFLRYDSRMSELHSPNGFNPDGSIAGDYLAAGRNPNLPRQTMEEIEGHLENALMKPWRTNPEPKADKK